MILAGAASLLGLTKYSFPSFSAQQYKQILQNHEDAFTVWKLPGIIDDVIQMACQYDLLCDGWITLLPFVSDLEEVKRRAKAVSNVKIVFVATSRPVEDTVKSELHHWTVHDLERQAELSVNERKELETNLQARAYQHQERITYLSGLVKILPLANNFHQIWPDYLASVSTKSAKTWHDALGQGGQCNSETALPIEGILLTMRLGNATEKIVKKLLKCIEEDKLCDYLLVLGIDEDEIDTNEARSIISMLKSRVESTRQMQSFHIVMNPSQPYGQPFAICRAWDAMAVEAWKNGAVWVVLLGDDVEIECTFHYRAVYRSFLDISHSLGVPLGFGCPFWNDCSFPGFPSFPCIGRAHYDIFQALIPRHRLESFVNQDFDPYVNTLYAKLGASPCVYEATLKNGVGGKLNPRYEKVSAQGWQDFVIHDFQDYIRPSVPNGTPEQLLLDVIVPSFRVRVDYLQSICSLKVPKMIKTKFIIIIDNKDALLRAARDLSKCSDSFISVVDAAEILERHLAKAGNTIRVRCNQANLGASASRNRGLDESAAEFVLNLDDDLIPDGDLLEQYGSKLMEIDEKVVGLVGLVRFPRSPDIPLRHAAVLMSYLTYAFEIAEHSEKSNPAWGVTANILFRRTKIRFDLMYAKTGGGEDVDYALRVTEACGGGSLLALPQARVVHPFWPGSFFALASHFHNWSIGDGALFKRFPNHCYWSFPNLPETILLSLPFCLLTLVGLWNYLQFSAKCIMADFIVDLIFGDYNHRINTVKGIGEDQVFMNRSHVFYIFAHLLANLYVIGLECGRLRGHIRRLDMQYGIFRRFDWHIGRLEDAPKKFRVREAVKFSVFCALFVHLLKEENDK